MGEIGEIAEPVIGTFEMGAVAGGPKVFDGCGLIGNGAEFGLN